MTQTEDQPQQVRIGYGPLVPPIEEQLAEQGLKSKDVDKFEKLRHAINVLRFAHIMPDSQLDKALGRLHKNVMDSLERIV